MDGAGRHILKFEGRRVGLSPSAVGGGGYRRREPNTDNSGRSTGPSHDSHNDRLLPNSDGLLFVTPNVERLDHSDPVRSRLRFSGVRGRGAKLWSIRRRRSRFRLGSVHCIRQA